MTLHELSDQFLSDSDRLTKEMNSYQNEAVMWKKTGAVNNPAGNLCWHISGNIQHFIGHVLGGTDYERDREYEFNCTNVPLKELLQEIEKAKKAVSTTLPELSSKKLSERFPINVLKHEMSTGFFLMHLLGHLNYHLGQISYHRRILDTP